MSLSAMQKSIKRGQCFCFCIFVLLHLVVGTKTYAAIVVTSGIKTRELLGRDMRPNFQDLSVELFNFKSFNTACTDSQQRGVCITNSTAQKRDITFEMLTLGGGLESDGYAGDNKPTSQSKNHSDERGSEWVQWIPFFLCAFLFGGIARLWCMSRWPKSKWFRLHDPITPPRHTQTKISSK